MYETLKKKDPEIYKAITDEIMIGLKAGASNLIVSMESIL